MVVKRSGVKLYVAKMLYPCSQLIRKCNTVACSYCRICCVLIDTSYSACAQNAEVAVIHLFFIIMDNFKRKSSGSLFYIVDNCVFDYMYVFKGADISYKLSKYFKSGSVLMVEYPVSAVSAFKRSVIISVRSLVKINSEFNYPVNVDFGFINKDIGRLRVVFKSACDKGILFVKKLFIWLL